MHQAVCHGCSGKGWVVGKDRAELCPVCNGSGLPFQRINPAEERDWDTGTPIPGNLPRRTTCIATDAYWLYQAGVADGNRPDNG